MDVHSSAARVLSGHRVHCLVFEKIDTAELVLTEKDVQ
jgi:hypothetical protein